jgi:hypothetical protein
LKAATIIQLKRELETYTHQRLIELLLSTAKYKVENKELLSFLLFDSDNLEGYVADIKLEIEEAFDDINNASSYIAVKRLRKVTKLIAKYVKYTSSKIIDAALTTYFCQEMIDRGYLRHNYKTIMNLYARQVDRLSKCIPKIHEDLQYDYTEKVLKFNKYL